MSSAGGGAEQFAPDEPGLEIVRAAPVAAPSHNLDQSMDLDESRVFDCRDLVTSAIEIHRGNQVRSRDVIQFVLLARAKLHPQDDIFGPHAMSESGSSNDTTTNPPPPETAATDNNNNRGTSWFVPDPMVFHDVVFLLCLFLYHS